MTPIPLTRWHRFPDSAALQREARSSILAAAQSAIASRGRFLIVLAGGNTPRGLYQLLRDSDANWPDWQVFFGDERCLPAANPDRNSSMAGPAWLDHVPIPSSQIHLIPAELGARAGAERYGQTLQGIGEFDCVLLGLGEDGHTASLFPGHDLGTASDAPDVLAVFDAPKPPPERISLSARRLSHAANVMFLISGNAKYAALRDWSDGVAIPAAAIAPRAGVDVMTAS